MSKKRFTFGAIMVEILIVIIGISIAFWVNSWGEERKQRRLEMEFLKTLRSELAVDSAAFSSQITSNKQNLQYLERFIEICRNKRYDNDSIGWFAGSFLNRNNWILNSNTYDILKSGGKLDIVSDFELRNDMSAFYKIRAFQTDRLFEMIQDFLDQRMFPYLTEHSDYFISYQPNLAFVEDTEFQNLLVIWSEFNETKVDVYQGTLEDIQSLMTKLDIELK